MTVGMDIFKNWKSSSIGIVAGVLYVASQAYKPGMSWKDWAVGAAIAIMGLVVKDATTHSTVAQIQTSTNQDAVAKSVPAPQIQTTPVLLEEKK